MEAGKSLYAWLNILTIAVPFIFSFYPSANFSKKWKYVLPAMIITAIIFILWDEMFTQMGVWGFNDRYITGIYVLSLPVEEVLFFFCIPYACVFTFFAFSFLIKKDHFASIERWITITLTAVLLVVGFWNLNRWYTGITFLSTAVFLVFVLWSRPSYMGRFYFAFLVLLIPFFVVNGILTGSIIEEPVVWYDPSEIIGIRIGTIPVEDSVYALLLILMNISIAAWLERQQLFRTKTSKKAQKMPSDHYR